MSKPRETSQEFYREISPELSRTLTKSHEQVVVGHVYYTDSILKIFCFIRDRYVKN